MMCQRTSDRTPHDPASILIDRHDDLSDDHPIGECHDASARLKLGVGDETRHETSVKLADVAKC